MAMSPNGSRVYVTGSSAGVNGQGDYATVSYDASTGIQQWVKRYNGPANGGDAASAIGISPDGSAVYVTGYSAGSTTGVDYATVAYGSAGELLWGKRYNGPVSGDDFANAIDVSPDGFSVYVTGNSPGFSGFGEWATIAYKVVDGSQTWADRYYDGQNAGSDNAAGVSVSPDNAIVYVTGDAEPNGGRDYLTLGYDAATGTTSFFATYDGGVDDSDLAAAVDVSPDGFTVYVTGFSVGSSGFADYGTVAYDASNSAQLWASHYAGSGTGDSSPRALAVSPDGSKVYVTGQTTGTSGTFDYGTVAYSAA
jgi:hypothetical protein